LLNLSDELVPLSGFQGQPDWIESAREGRPYFSLKDPKRDLKELDAQIISHPQDATLFFQRARVSQQLGKDKATLSDLNRAIELDATNANYILARAFYYHQLKNADAAEAEIRRAQDVDPAVPSMLTFDQPTKRAQQ
jgi:Flp pilus assembly protein TadD